MNTPLVDALVQAVLSLSPEERQRFNALWTAKGEQSLTHEHTPKPDSLEPSPDKGLDLDNEPFVGMWKDREEMANSTQWVRSLRQQEWQ